MTAPAPAPSLIRWFRAKNGQWTMIIPGVGTRWGSKKGPPKIYRDKSGTWRDRSTGHPVKKSEYKKRRLKPWSAVKRTRKRAPRGFARAMRRIRSHLQRHTGSAWRYTTNPTAGYGTAKTLFEADVPADYPGLARAFAAMADDPRIGPALDDIRGAALTILVLDPNQPKDRRSIGGLTGYWIGTASSVDLALTQWAQRLADLEHYNDSEIYELRFWFGPRK